MRKITIAEFWERITPKPNGCWEWQGAKTKQGYGTMWGTTAHRIAYSLSTGPIPEGMVVMHTCDNPSCCNPEHLRVGSQQENLADMHRKGRAGDCRNFGESHGMCKLSDAQVTDIKRLYASKSFISVTS